MMTLPSVVAYVCLLYLACRIIRGLVTVNHNLKEINATLRRIEEKRNV